MTMRFSPELDAQLQLAELRHTSRHALVVQAVEDSVMMCRTPVG